MLNVLLIIIFVFVVLNIILDFIFWVVNISLNVRLRKNIEKEYDFDSEKNGKNRK